MSQVEYVIDDYSIVVSEDATHVFHKGEWIGSRDKRHQALHWIYTLRRVRSGDQAQIAGIVTPSLDN